MKTKKKILSRLSWLGKERDLESGYGDHGVRKYNSTAGRFMSVDPLWEKYLSWTPYQYSGNNPVNAVDVDGRDIIFAYRAPGTYSKLDPGHISMGVWRNDPKLMSAGLAGMNFESTWSFTPKDNKDFLGITLFGTVSRQANFKSDIKDATELLVLNTNQQFDNILTGIINARKSENEKYQLFENNCSTTKLEIINQALSIFKSSIILNISIIPSNSMETIKNNKERVEDSINTQENEVE